MKIIPFITILLAAICFSYSSDFNILPEKIEFGQVSSDASKITKEIKIVNLDTSVLIISEYKFTSNPANMLNTSAKIPFEITKNSSKFFDIALTPSDFFYGRFEVFLLLKMGSDDTTAKILITGEVFKNPKKSIFEITIPEIKAKVNTNIKIPVILNKFERNDHEIDNFNLALTYNSTILFPVTTTIESEIKFGKRISVFNLPLNKNATEGDTIASIDFITALGNASATDIIITSSILKLAGETVQSENIYHNGRIELTDLVYFDDVPRLISQKSSNYIIYSTPNPILNDFELNLDYISDARLEIYSVDGVLITDLSSMLPYATEKRNYTLTIQKNYFPGTGAYIIKLSGKEEQTSKMVIIK